MYRGLHYDDSQKAIVSDFGNVEIVKNVSFELAFDLINYHLIGEYIDYTTPT